MSLRTMLRTVLHVLPNRRWSAMVTPSCSGQSRPEKRTRWPTLGVRSDSRSLMAGRTITSWFWLSALPERAR